MAFDEKVGERLVRGLEPKKLPYGGKWYTFPTSVSAATGVVLQRILDHSVQAADGGKGAPDLSKDIFDGLTEKQQKAIESEILGDTLDKLVKDGVPNAVVGHMISTLVVWHMTGSREHAELVWADVGPKAPADRKPKKAASSRSAAGRSSAKATTTRRRTSTTRTARTK